MKNFMIGAVLAMAFASSAFAADASGILSVQDKFVDRGIVLREEPTATLDLLIQNVVLGGVFVSANLATTDLNKEDLSLRTNFGVGYGFDVAGFDVSASLHRQDNTALYADAFNSVRAEVGYTFGSLRPYAFGERVLTTVADDTYMGAGVQWQALDRLRLDLAAFGYQYDAGSTKFNHASLTGTYNLTGSFDAFATYNYGGENIVDRPLKDSWTAGVALRF